MAPRVSKDVVQLPRAFKEPRALCPFSGQPLQYVPITTKAAGHDVVRYQVRGTGWVSTTLFQTLEAAHWHFSHDHGLAPAFPDPHTRVSVREIEEPEGRTPADDVKDAEKLAVGLGEDLAKDMK